MELTPNAESVLSKRYYKPGETWKDLVNRLVTHITANSNTRTNYYNAIFNRQLLPNTPALINAGTSMPQMSACYVLPVLDDIRSIFDAVKHAAIIHKSGGGTGFSFSKLRAAGRKVNSTNGVASGPISFMKVFNEATGAIKQGGVRRGANMGMLDVTHPDIIDFINCKLNQKELNNFNISVALTYDFIQKARLGMSYDLFHPDTGEVAGQLNARDVLWLIATNAHKNGEPGVVFIDEINKCNPTPHLGNIEATNPCGEQPLLPNEACVLASINLQKVFDGDNIDYKLLEHLTMTGILMLNDIIDTSQYPLPEIHNAVHANRKIGLGVMGWADMLAQKGLPYDSDDARKLADTIMGFVQETAHQTSEYLAKIKGSYPSCNGVFRRNATVTTIAPTGSISMIADCSSGIEPYFSLAYTKTVIDNTEYVYVNPYLEKYLGDNISNKVMKEIIKYGSIAHIDSISQEIKDIFATAQEISVEGHIDMQAAFQEHVDNAVSKTINMSKDSTVQDVYDAIISACDKGCKGITIYRDGSRDNQVLSVGYVAKDIKYNKCPECSGDIAHVEGCATCHKCGWSICSV